MARGWYWLRIVGLLGLLGAWWWMSACVTGGKGCLTDLDCGSGGQTCKAGECSCLAPRAQCGILCVETQTNNTHCGTCNRTCGQNQRCEGGSCRCNGNLGLCDGRCVDTQSDPTHCGVCGQACSEGQICVKGKCEAVPCPSNTPILCGASCVDTKTNPQHCGGCGRSCAQGESCKESLCVGSCPSEKPANCGGNCIDPKSDARHCGQCEMACPAGAACSNGACLCPQGQSICDGRCVDLTSDAAHCGGCGKLCANGSSCVLGRCNDCVEGQSRTCYDGLAGTDGVGVCKKGQQACKGGFWQPCEGQILPSVELPQDQKDNDCDGRVDEALQVITLLGTSDTLAEGAPKSSRFSDVTGFWAEGDGTLFLADKGNHRLRKVSSTGQISTFVGSSAGLRNGALLNALFSSPSEVVRFAGVDGFFVSDTGNSRIRFISADGSVSSLVSLPSPQSYFQGLARVFVSNSKLYYVDSMGANVLVSGTSVVSSLLRVDAASGFVAMDHQIARLRILDGKATLSAFAGSATAGYLDAKGSLARFRNPRGMAMDSQGNLYVADAGNHCVRKVEPTGVVTTFAEEFFQPSAVGVDAQEQVYVMSMGSRLLYKVSSSGQVTHHAGTGMGWFDNADPLKARFGQISSLVVDAQGTIFVADYGNGLLRQIDKAGNVSTLARVTSPSDLALGDNGELVVTSLHRHRILSFDKQKNLKVLAGDGNVGTVNGQGSAARLAGPFQVAKVGGLYYFTEPFANGGQIRTIDAQGNVKDFAKIAGVIGLTGGSTGPSSSGIIAFTKNALHLLDDMGTSLLVKTLPSLEISSVSISPQSEVFVAARDADQTGLWGIFKIEVMGGETLWAGTKANNTHQDGPRLSAGFGEIKYITFDAQGNLYIAEQAPHRIRKLDVQGNVSTLAGGDIWDGSVESATFLSLSGVAMGEQGELFFSDLTSNRIRHFIPSSKKVETFAGYGAYGKTGGPGSLASFALPRGVTRSLVGALYVADTNNYKIRVISPQGIVSDFAGTGEGGWSDGSTSSARFQALRGLQMGPDGMLYVLESTGIRKIDLAKGEVTTLTGASTFGMKDGTLQEARFNELAAMSFDAQGNILVADSGNHRIRKIDLLNQSVSTLAGDGVRGFLEGDALKARFNGPRGIWVDTQGNVFVADTANRRMRLIDASGKVSTLAGTGTIGYVDGDALEALFFAPEKMFFDARGQLCTLDRRQVRCLSR